MLIVALSDFITCTRSLTGSHLWKGVNLGIIPLFFLINAAVVPSER